MKLIQYIFSALTVIAASYFISSYSADPDTWRAPPKSCKLVASKPKLRHYSCPKGHYMTGARSIGSDSPVITVRCVKLTIKC